LAEPKIGKYYGYADVNVETCPLSQEISYDQVLQNLVDVGIQKTSNYLENTV
jgi:hypothetical protein